MRFRKSVSGLYPGLIRPYNQSVQAMRDLEQKDLNQKTNQNESHKILTFVFLFVVMIAADQLLKFKAKNLFRNYNFAFSLPLPIWLMYLIYVFVLLFMGYYVRKNYQHFSRKQAFAWTLVFAGAVSNILERVALGYVRDFIYIYNGVFNAADFFIVAGILLLLLPSSKLEK